MTPSRRRFLTGLLPLGALVLAAGLGRPAAADVIPPEGRFRPSLGFRAPAVTLASSDAPGSDAQAVQASVRRELYSRQSRLNRCVAGIDFREDPFRSRSREVSGTLTFDRSGRASIRLTRTEGVPPAAVSCVREVLSAVRVRPAPRGEVVLRFRYPVAAR